MGGDDHPVMMLAPLLHAVSMYAPPPHLIVLDISCVQYEFFSFFLFYRLDHFTLHLTSAVATYKVDLVANFSHTAILPSVLSPSSHHTDSTASPKQTTRQLTN